MRGCWRLVAVEVLLVSLLPLVRYGINAVFLAVLD